MLPFFLILLLSLFVFYSISFMMKKGHDLHALSFFTLYIYTIFTQIGYVYFPELSDFYGAYFGPLLFYKYWAFMFFSFVFAFLLYLKINPAIDKKNIFSVRLSSSNYGEYCFFLFTILIYIILRLYFSMYRELFSYGGGNSMGGPWFGIGYWIFTICTFILYTLFRDNVNNNKKRILSMILFFICILFFLQVSVASGSRSSIFYFFISLCVYELFPIIKSVNKKKEIFALIVSGFILFNILGTLREIRSSEENINISSLLNYEKSESVIEDANLSTNILLQDYFLPSHTLFLSMQYNIIDPLEVMRSNLANSFVGIDYPFLTTTIMKIGLGQDNDRGVGWAYHTFVEGYNVIGMSGVFYNALFWNLAMLLWIRLTQSNNVRFNQVMVGLIALLVAFTARGQFSVFIKFYWLVLLPGSILVLLANNSTIAFFSRMKLVNKNK